MPRLKAFPLNSGVFSLAITAGALVVSLLLRPLLEPNFFPVFLAAILVGAWFHGTAGGLFTTLLSVLTVGFFLLPEESRAGNPAARLVVFGAVGLLIAWLVTMWSRSRDLLKATLVSMGDCVIATDSGGRITFMNPLAEALTGWRQADAHGRPLTEVLRLVHESSREELENPAERALREGAPVNLSPQALLISRDGTEIPIEDSAGPIRDARGHVHGVILLFRDVTSRRQLEEQLSHAEKMDAVGRLAAGVAGDFNNVLTVITGYSELLRIETPAGSPLRRFADEIIYAAERAVGLTRQLLAFSRGQAAQPKVIDLNAVLSGMEPMLRRLLGDSVDLIILPGPNLGRVKADAAQIEQVVMNLASNARDAMPNGGKLVLETTNIELEEPVASKKVGARPGSYVMLVMSDTGVGMDANSRSRLFEPFFTTKERGKGSGLGLSAVYGIIKQHDGYITVYSQVGCGTIFEVYLPLVHETSVPAHREPAPKGSETILLVDDEEGVRKLVFAILRSNGYTVIEASNGNAALHAFEKNSHKIDLVLTDVVMPQMDGFELGRQLSELSPELKILYMSGYRDNPIGGQPSGQVRPFLHKPFTPDVLLTKVREVLDTRATA